MIKKIIFILFISILINAQQQSQIVAIGDSLIGKMINGESIREIRGHVVMTQGAVRITCDKAIQFMARNEADLIGNVVVTQDSIVVKTTRGHYYGNTKVAFSNSGITFTDGHVVLTSKNGYYYFDEKRSFFYDNVILKEGISNLSASVLNYYDDEDKAVATKNVIVRDTSSTLLADSLIYYRKTKFTEAFSNIRIYNSTDNIAIFGNRLEDYGSKHYTKIWDNPFFIRIDTTDDGKVDTLMTSAGLMESYDDSTKILIASDSVKIIRGNFSAVNNKAVYFRRTDEIQAFKEEGDEYPPVIWNEESQLSGDSIYISLQDRRLKKISINSNATIISARKDNPFRFDQIAGKKVEINFNEKGIDYTYVNGNALSIYYMYDDDNEPNGLIKSSSENAKIFFTDGKVTDVKLYVKPSSEFHPENLITGKEKDFTIPSFRIFSNKPTKESLLSYHKKKLTFWEKDSIYHARKPNSTKRKS